MVISALFHVAESLHSSLSVDFFRLKSIPFFLSGEVVRSKVKE